LNFQVVEFIVPSFLICPFLTLYLAEVLDILLPLNIGELSIIVESNETRLLPGFGLTAEQVTSYATNRLQSLFMPPNCLTLSSFFSHQFQFLSFLSFDQFISNSFIYCTSLPSYPSFPSYPS
jgi:hypothetical protein